MTVTRRRRTGRKARQNRRAVIIAIIACASCLILVASLCIWLMMSGGQSATTLTEEQIAEQTQQQEALFEASLEAEEEKNSEYMNSKTIDQIVGAGKEVSKALSLRPQTVEMTDENRDEFVNTLVEIDFCIKQVLFLQSIERTGKSGCLSPGDDRSQQH